MPGWGLPQRSIMVDKDTDDPLVEAVGHDVTSTAVHREIGLNSKRNHSTSKNP